MSIENLRKIKFIIKIKKYFGKDSIIEDFTGYSQVSKDKNNNYDDKLERLINFSGSFRNKNLICVKNPKNNHIFWIFFHYSKDMFYGFNKITVDEIFNLQKKDDTNKVFSFLLLIEDSKEKEIYFLIPLYFIKRLETKISVSKKDSPQLKLNLIFKNDKYIIKLLKNVKEDISNFQIKINQLFDNRIYKKFNEEKVKYRYLSNSRKNLLELCKNNINKNF